VGKSTFALPALTSWWGRPCAAVVGISAEGAMGRH